ncbi:sulfatase family protein [Candidatus Colwellia aromaticivorans]|uniref:sulfatase family protein n=1 Tax=Candidatus Colwellia aromaticivorans TaxID=2267621 RepID=UPI000DF3AEB1|nr:sulfatase [Candidatus Colwellia aromaticivorans]
MFINYSVLLKAALAAVWLSVSTVYANEILPSKLPSSLPTTKPNIVFIFADDLGYGDVSSFGATDIKTPHLDQLADDGIKFTNFYAAANVCSPSRASLLTGRHSVRMGISSVFMSDSPDGMPLSEITIAEALKPQGYATGMVGKWHLGHSERYMPLNQGFDEFYGVPYSNDMGNFFWHENNDIDYSEIDQRYLTKRYTEKAIDFIDRHQQQPFFLYLAHNMPHVPLYASPSFEGSSERGLYGDVVQELDWGVGEIVKALKKKGLWENTLLVFSSDNGPWLMMGDHGGSAGELRHGKMTTFEGGHRVPTIAHWPKGIKPREYHGVASMLDWFPTFVELAGAKLPDDRVIDGNSLTSLLGGENTRDDAEFIYFNKNNQVVEGIRQGRWKLKIAHHSYLPAFIEYFANVGEYSHPLMLIDMENDPGETTNLAKQYPQIVTSLKARIAQYQTIKPEQRWLIMKATSADHKGYGYIKTVGLLAAISVLLLAIALIYGIYRSIKFLFLRKRKQTKNNS